MTVKVDKTTNDTTKFTWDIENRLMKVEKPGTVAEYVYGPLGRRLRKTVNGVSKELRYDGVDLIIEMDENDVIVAQYTFGPGIDQPLMMNRNSNNYYYLADGLGSITGITDSVGNVLQEYKYSVFGKIMEQTADSIENSFTYTGREWEPEVELYYYRNRFYDPYIGRFISEDPFGFRAGDLNLFRYVFNIPIMFRDPFGLQVIAIFNRSTGELFLMDTDAGRGGYIITAESGWHQDPNVRFGPIPVGEYSIVDEPWGLHDANTWFGLFKTDDGQFDDFIQSGEGTGRGLFRMHRFVMGSDGCVSANCSVTNWSEIADWIKGTETSQVTDADNIRRTSYGTLTVTAACQ